MVQCCTSWGSVQRNPERVLVLPDLVFETSLLSLCGEAWLGFLWIVTKSVTMRQNPCLGREGRPAAQLQLTIRLRNHHRLGMASHRFLKGLLGGSCCKYCSHQGSPHDCLLLWDIELSHNDKDQETTSQPFFLGGPLIRIPHSPCWGPGFNPRSEN